MLRPTPRPYARRRRGWSLLALAALAAAPLGCSPEQEPPPPGEELPGMQLLARVEARLERARPALRAMPAHLGEVFPVEPDVLHAFMRQIRAHGAGPDVLLGVATAPESHGGGLLRLLLDHWRPEDRPARLADAYPVTGRAAPLSLAELYAAHRQQIVLPVDGRALDAIDGALPETPRLPRLVARFRPPFGSERVVDLDAYTLLGLLIRLEPDASAVWRNRAGQPLSVALLVRHVREHYLASDAPRAEPEDHSDLHLVELLVAFDRAHGAHGDGPRALHAVKRHLLDVELAEQAFEPRDAAVVTAHLAESLGHLLAADGLRWSRDDARLVRRWLAALETRFATLEGVALQPLCHLAKGLRAVRAHGDALE